MGPLDLRYLASRAWMEAEILSGNAIRNREQILSVQLDKLDESLQQRARAVEDAVLWVKVEKEERPCVLDSGIDPELSFGKSEKSLTAVDEPILNEVGRLPELEAPTDDVEAVVAAWEKWLDRYIARATEEVERLNNEPPPVGRDAYTNESYDWGVVWTYFGGDVSSRVSPAEGAKAMQDARAGNLWRWAARQRFSSESVAAAKEAVTIPQSQAQQWLEELEPRDLAAKFLDQTKKEHRAAKAHDAARAAKVPSFEVEMKRWTIEQGSDRLRLGLEDGYRMNSRYLTERIAAEAPGMFAVPANSVSEDWAAKASSPSESALRLRRRVEAAVLRHAPPNLEGPSETEIMIVKKPPPEIYRPDPGVETSDGLVGKEFPSREGWPWYVDEYEELVGAEAKPFEAVVVKHWLGRFHLIGAVSDREASPPGIWAVPDLDQYGEDGTVLAQDPDAPTPAQAKRKPPEPTDSDDIPF